MIGAKVIVKFSFFLRILVVVYRYTVITLFVQQFYWVKISGIQRGYNNNNIIYYAPTYKKYVIDRYSKYTIKFVSRS